MLLDIIYISIKSCENNFNDPLWKFDFNWKYMYRNVLEFIVSFLKKVKTYLEFLRQKINFNTFY